MSSRFDPKVFVWDAREAAEAAMRFARGKRFEEFVADDLLRSGIERQLLIAGEALTRLARAEPGIAEHIPHLRQIIAFRNIPSMATPPSITRTPGGLWARTCRLW